MDRTRNASFALALISLSVTLEATAAVGRTPGTTSEIRGGANQAEASCARYAFDLVCQACMPFLNRSAGLFLSRSPCLPTTLYPRLDSISASPGPSSRT